MTGILTEKELSAGCFILEIPEQAVPLPMVEISAALGYPTGEPPSAMAEIIGWEMKEIIRRSRIRAGYSMVSVALPDNNQEHVLLGGRLFRTEKIIRSQLKGSSGTVLFTCTIGSGPEQRVKALTEADDGAQAFIADCIASVLAEQAAEVLHRHLEEKMKGQALGVTNRFSPGYCGWDVQEQRGLFLLLPEKFCGISLGESAFMTPRKSISGIIGVGKNMKRTDYPCSQCSEGLCIYKSKEP